MYTHRNDIVDNALGIIVNCTMHGQQDTHKCKCLSRNQRKMLQKSPALLSKSAKANKPNTECKRALL